MQAEHEYKEKLGKEGEREKMQAKGKSLSGKQTRKETIKMRMREKKERGS